MVGPDVPTSLLLLTALYWWIAALVGLMALFRRPTGAVSGGLLGLPAVVIALHWALDERATNPDWSTAQALDVFAMSVVPAAVVVATLVFAGLRLSTSELVSRLE